ncbi:hypothetical protein [Methylibium sp. Root1272]|uniref:hypothetical protein n=1 Tax=Methylibium sp. Root1272 TaxID=1736441 RepID=UPI0006FA19CE|nr:hypothetical protein [Methylibium sp. Root1272]KQW75174.1 hypothetical protein ASC67_17895 [Methylibium sp. Root1272]
MQSVAPAQRSAQWTALRDAAKRRWCALPPALRAHRALIVLGLSLAAVFLIAFYAVVDGAVQRSSAAQQVHDAGSRPIYLRSASGNP